MTLLSKEFLVSAPLFLPGSTLQLMPNY